jgi:hypothetical protein
MSIVAGLPAVSLAGRAPITLLLSRFELFNSGKKVPEIHYLWPLNRIGKKLRMVMLYPDQHLFS